MSENITVNKELFVEKLDNLMKALYNFAYDNGYDGIRNNGSEYEEDLNKAVESISELCNLKDYSFVYDESERCLTFMNNDIIVEKLRKEKEKQKKYRKQSEELWDKMALFEFENFARKYNYKKYGIKSDSKIDLNKFFKELKEEDEE